MSVCAGVAPAVWAQAAQQAPAQTPQPQTPADPSEIDKTACGTPVGAPAALPPAGSPPFIWIFELCFARQGGSSTVENETYLYWLKLKDQVSQPSKGLFVPYDEKAEQMMAADFKALWATNFLDDLSIEVTDHAFPGGVVGKMVVYHLEERERIKIVDYRNTKGDSVSIIKRSDIDTKLREKSIEIRLDSFLDEGTIRKVKTVLKEMMAEKGFTNAEISNKVTPVAGGPKLVNVTFTVGEGPKIKIRSLEFVGNQAIGDGKLQRKMKENKPKGLLGFITGGGTYKEAEYEEDAAKVVEYYQNKGYPQARVGNPEIKVLEDTKDGKTRWVQLRIPITEGHRYKFGQLSFEGNKLVRSDGLRLLYKVEPGDWYNRKKLTDGNKKAQEIYGSRGYMEFTPFPTFKFSDDPNNPESLLASMVPAALAAPATDTPRSPAAAEAGKKPPTVDVMLQMTEGPQYFVNRITFTGNTTTRDNVIRREVRLYEGGVFDTESLKYSVRRLNQLGYFKELKGNDTDMHVEKTPNKENNVDVTLKFEEQNRNQLTFGAGVSQYEGLFGQLAFQTSNFLGRGESLTVSMQAGDRAQNYQLAFTEPFLFDRNITGGFDVFKRELRYIGQFTQKSIGAVATIGLPIADFTRFYANYSYERTRVTEIADVYQDPLLLARNPFLRDSLLIGAGGERIISKVVPSIVHNTVDNPIFPTSGKRYSFSIDLAGLGGNTNFYKPLLEGVWYWRQTGRFTLGGRAHYEYIHTFTGSKELPIFEKLYQGGEYSVRGFDIRTIGPQDPVNGLVLGGNKSLLFNVEQMFSIAPQVRLIFFYDAGQVQAGPELVGPSAFVPDGGSLATTVKKGVNFRLADFKTSTGAEIRFFMPVLNVPFRLIFAYNPQRKGVLDNELQPQKAFQFRFAVGSTF